MERSKNKSLLPALLVSLSLGIGFAGSLVTEASAQGKIEFQAKKLNAAQLLRKQRESIAFIFQAFKKIPKAQRGKSAPFLKALLTTSKAIKDVEKTVKTKNNKQFAVALPKLAQAIAQLNQTYKLSKLRDKKVGIGVTTLNKAWRQYLKRVQGSKAANNKDLARNNGRRIHDMRRRLDKMGQNKHMTNKQKRELERLRRLLDKAQANNRRANQQWYTSIILADFAGYYAQKQRIRRCRGRTA